MIRRPLLTVALAALVLGCGPAASSAGTAPTTAPSVSLPPTSFSFSGVTMDATATTCSREDIASDVPLALDFTGTARGDTYDVQIGGTNVASGTTSLTAGLSRSRLAMVVEMVAAIALTTWKPRTCVACTCPSSDMMPFWSALAALTRSLAVDPAAGRPVSWFLNTMIERWFALAESRATSAALNVDGEPLKTWPGPWPALAGPPTVRVRSTAPVSAIPTRKLKRLRIAKPPGTGNSDHLRPDVTAYCQDRASFRIGTDCQAKPKKSRFIAHGRTRRGALALARTVPRSILRNQVAPIS